MLLPASPAAAYWSAGGLSSGSGAVATMPAGLAPAGTAVGASVTVSWPQSTFLGTTLGSFSAGGYTLRRYPSGGTPGVTPGAPCATAIGGAALELQCTEPGVPFGRWQYSVTPSLGTFTGDEGPRSAAITVAPDAPVLAPPVGGNPAAGQAAGSLALTWAAVTGATGYNVYRRTTAGSFDFAAPLNGAIPLSATTFTDPGAGLSGGTAYVYVVRATAASPVVESASSNERGATPITRPAAPMGVQGAAGVAARIDVGWSSVAGAAGYNVFRRTSAGAYGAALNGATPVAGTTFADLTSVNATSYHYTVRAVITGAGGAQVESADSAESAAVTADSVPPPVPSATLVTSGGNVMSVTRCSIASGTRYINSAGMAAVGLSATIAAPEAGQTVVFSATSTGSTPVTGTVPATGTTVPATLNLTTLVDGTLTVTARTKDAAGNLSATTAPTNVVIKDTVVPALSASYSGGFLGLDPTLSGSSECGASIRATKTFGGNVGSLWPASGPHVITSGTSWSFGVEGPLLGLGSVTYSVLSTDRAGNASAAVSAG